jgi:Flp pilus assembly protein TadG
MMKGFTDLFRRFGADRSGAALIELAFAVPVLVVILLGCFEATRYVLLHQKMNRAAASTADLVAQLNGITTDQLADLFDAASRLLEPYDLGANGRIIVTSVYRPDADDPAVVAWQRLSSSGIAVSSDVGAEGAEATLPAGLTVDAGENVVVTEVFYSYSPFFFGTLFEPSQLQHDAYNRPRISNLTQITN